MKPSRITAFFALFLNIVMILFAREVTTAEKNGLLLWFNYALPSLLPFIIITDIMSKSGFTNIIKRPLSPITKLLFGMDGSSLFPIVAGFTSGCPVGVKVTCDLCIAKSISKADAQRLICFTNNSGPLFIISTVGVCLLNNQNYGLIILLLHYASALTTGIILSRTVKSCPLPAKDTTPPSFGTLVTTAVSDGMETIAKIGGYIILFSVLVKITELVGFTGLISYILSPFGVRSDYVKALTAAFFEVTNGCSALCKLPHSVLLCAAALSWGGLSIHAQSIGFIKKAGLKITPYILCRILQTATTLIYGIAFSIITGYPL